MPGGDTMEMARAERVDLAGFLAGLTAQQWDAPTLCEGWRVRDVVAHVYSYEDVGLTGFFANFVRAGLSPDRANLRAAAAHADRPPDELLSRARELVRPRGFSALLGGRIALSDGMIHHQDIRRPLGLRRDIPADRLVAALDMARSAPPIGARKRIAGLRLVATDVGWATGDGPAVEGPGEALLMAMAGRRGVADELSGPGAVTLRNRIGG